MTLALIILLPLVGSLLPWATVRLGRLWAPSAAALVTASALALLISQAPAVYAGETLLLRWEWIPAIGLNIALRLDGLAFLFALLILGIGLLIILYARYYLSESDPLGRFYLFLLLFMGAMLGIVMAENLLLLVIAWELTGLSSFLLIGYWHHSADARQGARMALAVTGMGGLALLAGVLLLGHVVGSYELSDVLAAGEQVRASDLYAPILALVLLGAFTKSAQFPFHFWLPAAMVAPTPVSAYLHSAAMVKAGVFLIARLFPVLSGTELWFFVVGGVGLATLLFAAYAALFKHDIKGLLAYSTVSHLGLITLLFGLGTPLGAVAGVFHIMNHATFKASLFMAAGIIDHEAGTRDMRRMRALFKSMPHTASLAIVAAGAMAGVPLLNGFLSKEMFFAETLHLERLGEWSWVLPAAATLSGVFAVAYSARFIHDTFFGKGEGLDRTPHEPPRWMKIPVEILVFLVLAVGLAPALIVGPSLAAAAASTLQAPLPEYNLKIWHGFGAPLYMSVVALLGGVLVYTQRRYLFRLHDEVLPSLRAEAAYAAFMSGLHDLARAVTRLIANDSLQRYLVYFFVTVLILASFPFWRSGLAPGQLPLTPIDGVSAVGAFVLAAACVGLVLLHRERAVAIVLVGVVGLVVSLLFVRFSAPDLALTQISVEVVTTVLFLLVLYFLPARGPSESAVPRRVRDGVLALLAGAGVASLVWAVLTRPLATISGYFIDQSVPGGGGTNVVNVILVDFRGYDTLGEITVLAIAALGVYGMIHALRLPHQPAGPGGRAWAADRHPLIMAVLTRPFLPMTLLVAVYLLLRGHNQPGGGFIAGLVVGVALIMQYLASGLAWAHARMPVNYTAVVGVGLFCAGATGIGSFLFDAPFLTSAHGKIDLPVIGGVELATAMLFDLGVFLTVVGAVMLILARIGHVSTSTLERPGSHTEVSAWNP